MRDKLLKHKEAAEFLGISPKTLYNWVCLKKIGVVRLSARALRYREKDLIEFRDDRLQVAEI